MVKDDMLFTNHPRASMCNSYTFSIFYLQDFSPIIRLLLSHQSLVDGAAFLFAMILLLQPPNWIPGLSILDEFVCHAWNGQFIYWCSVHISGHEQTGA